MSTSAQPSSSKVFFSSFLGNLAAFAFLGAIIVTVGIYLVVVLSMIASGPDTDAVPQDSALVLDLSLNLADSPPYEDVSAVMDDLMLGRRTRTLYLLEVVDAIKRAADDPNIKALFLTGSIIPENYGSGLATLREVRSAIQYFQSQDKPVYAYTTSPSLRDYYLMSAANHLLLNPFGLISLNGLATEGTFFGQAFEKYGIGVQTTRVGKYKSAVEMFTSDKMSPADREQMESLLQNLWQEIVSEIALSRKLDPQELLQQANTKGFYNAHEALDSGLVDEVVYYDSALSSLQEIVDYDHLNDTFAQISLEAYIDARGFRKVQSAAGFPSSRTTVAVLYAEGDIVDGEGAPGLIGGDSLARELRSLRLNPDIDAIVLRINSPGGSAVAAEQIEREVNLARECKPLVVSMGSLAASGGYWIAAPAQRIYAEPYTITGSIGVWGLIFNLKDIANRHGITFDGVKTSTFADIYTISREKTPEEMALIQEFTDFIYEAFIQKVSDGRDMTQEQVENIAQGRVWTGRQAHEIGLIDEIGGLEQAIEHAAKLVDPDRPWIVHQVPEKVTFSEALANFLGSDNYPAPLARKQNNAVSQALNRVQQEILLMQNLNDPRSVYARLPWVPTIP